MLKIRLIIFLITLLLLAPGPFSNAFGQSKDPVRVELNANLDMEDYNLVPCGENGIIVFFESEKVGSNEDTRIWHFAMYNKHFEQQWLADTALVEGMKFVGHAANDHNTFLFFIDQDKIRSEFNFQALTLDYGVNNFKIVNASIPDKSDPLEFKVRGNQAIIPLNNPTFQPRIAILDLKTASLRNIKPEIEGLNIIQQAIYDADDRSWYFILDNYLGKKKSALILLHTSDKGDIKRTIRLNPVLENKVLNESRIASVSGDTLLVIGTYHSDAAKLKSNDDDKGVESAGYFICRFISDQQEYINYYNFLEFEEMFKSLSSKTIAEIRKKAEKQKSNGKEYSIDYTLILHDVIPFGDDYIMLSEAYYPEYRTVTNMYYDYYGRPIPQTYTVFDGYKYISGIAASFNSMGELRWDNGIEIKNILTFNLRKHIGTFSSDNNELALFYSNENKIYYKMVGDAESGGGAQNMSLEKLYKGDKLMEDIGSQMIHWYNNYFICYGYQKIKNNRVSGGKRTIFYFSKLAFN